MVIILPRKHRERGFIELFVLRAIRGKFFKEFFTVGDDLFYSPPRRGIISLQLVFQSLILVLSVLRGLANLNLEFLIINIKRDYF